MLSFVAASLAVLLMPGPTNTILAGSGGATGFRRAAALPVAEAVGYSIAVGAFLAASSFLSTVPFALPTLKAIAAVWLLITAYTLWRQPVVPDLTERRGAFVRVLVTTLLNPKAMLVGTVLIPGMAGDRQGLAAAVFVGLSILAGIGWVALGSLLPKSVRRYSYKGAALVVLGFSIAAAASAGQL